MPLIQRQAYPLLCYLLLLTAVFFLIQISFFIQCTNIYFGDFDYISKQIKIPIAILPGVIFFIFAQILVHLSYPCLIWITTLPLARAFKCSTNTAEKLGITLWIFGIISILIANQYFFPNSKFSGLSRMVFPDTLIHFLFLFINFVWISIFTLAAFGWLIHLRRNVKTIISIAAISFISWFCYQQYFYVTSDAGTKDKPNIILIGVDSLRPDFLGYFGSSLKTPFFNRFLQQATVFSNAYTPLARTFPSWASILLGKYPKEIPIRFNLPQQDKLNLQTSLPTILHQHGYKTLFATDETRFSNMDKNFGFDEVVTPPMGLNDFLLGTFNDFPIPNLLLNTWIGKWLFPYSYSNRPIFVTYEPSRFLSLLKPYLKKSRQEPLFLAVHFCLPHYPYLWRSYSGVSDTNSLTRYQASIQRVDQQVSDFIVMLEHYHVLQHAIIVLLSDHGEALELAGDRITAAQSYVSPQRVEIKKFPRFYPPSTDEEEVNQSAGHGTDVLGLSQYHSLLAFRLYGLEKQSVKTISNLVLLLDIKPTVLGFLHITDKNSGLSLQHLILGQSSLLPHRGLFLESDFSPQAIRSVHPETRNLVFEGIEFFTIDQGTTRILVKKSMAQLIISSKQYAYLDQDWILALYPQTNKKVIPVLVNLTSGKWTTDLGTPFAQKSPFKNMLYALKNFYGSEIGQI